MAWRTPILGLGVSSPIVSGDLVLLTSQLGRGPLQTGSHPALVRGGPNPEGEQPLGGQRMDGTGKGGIVFSIVDQLQVPVCYISYGEATDAFKLFDEQQYVHELLEA